MDPIKLQQDLRNNQEDLQNYVRDLRNWTDQIKKRDKELSSRSKTEDTLATATGSSKGGGDSKRSEAPKGSTATESDESQRKKMAKKGDPSEEVVMLKEAGNECLKNKKYEDAIKHYSAAMELDPNYHILPANRGMAYLKLNSFEKAEEDCGRAILLDPQYIKGYLRRGSARLELGKLQLARGDYQKVLELEKHNPQAKMGLERIRLEEAKQARLQTAKAKGDQSTTAEAPTKSPKDTTEPPQATTKSLHLRSKKPLKKIPVAQVRNDDELESFIEQGRISRGEDASRVVTNGTDQTSTVPGKEEGEVSEKAPKTEMEQTGVPRTDPPTSDVSTPPFALPAAPRSSYEFIRDWKLLRTHGELRRRYLLQIPPDEYAAIFKQALEESTLVEILRVAESLSAAEIGSHLRGLSRVQRVDVLVMFMGAEDKKLLQSLISRCSADGQDMSDVKKQVGL